MHSLIEQAFRTWPGDGEIVAVDLGQEVALARSVGGYTITIQRVYADANRVVIGCLLSRTSGAASIHGGEVRMPWRLPTLVDATEAELRQLGGASCGMGDEVGYYFTYDTPPLPSPAAPLRLRFTVPLLVCHGAEGTETIEGLGPFNFDLSVPVDPRARVVESNQSGHWAAGLW